MKQLIPNFDTFLYEMKQKGGAFAKVFLDSNVVVKFSSDKSEAIAWAKLLEGNVYKLFPQTPKIYGIFECEKTGDNRYVIIMEQIKEIPNRLADKIEDDMMNNFRTTYIERVFNRDSFQTLDKSSPAYKIIDYCKNYNDFCQSLGITMRVMEIQNIGIKNDVFAFYDMGECTFNKEIEKFDIINPVSNDMLSIAKELIKKYK